MVAVTCFGAQRVLASLFLGARHGAGRRGSQAPRSKQAGRLHDDPTAGRASPTPYL